LTSASISGVLEAPKYLPIISASTRSTTLTELFISWAWRALAASFSETRLTEINLTLPEAVFPLSILIM
jgi:hypothetical protein